MHYNSYWSVALSIELAERQRFVYAPVVTVNRIDITDGGGWSRLGQPRVVWTNLFNQSFYSFQKK
jgi:hypothetical protein